MSTLIIIIYILLGIAFLFALGWLIITLVKRRRRKADDSILKEVLEDFDYAEKRIAESSGEENPNQILWDIAQSKSGFRQDPRMKNAPLPPYPKKKIYAEPNSAQEFIDGAEEYETPKEYSPKRKIFGRRYKQ